MTPWNVVFSERLGALTDVETRLEADTAVQLTVAALRTEDELIANAAGADVLVVGAVEPVTAYVLRSLPKVKAIVRRGIGVDNVDVATASELGIAVAFVPAATVEEVSDHALALALGLARRLQQIESAVRRGDSAESARLGNTTRRLNELTLGLVGFGRIGRAMARKSSSVFGGIIAYDPMIEAGTVVDRVEIVELETLWSRADILTLHAPGSAGNRALINADSMSSMKRGVLIVNTARGQLIDEEALIDAVASGKVGGAALDVTSTEPLPLDSPLLTCDGIVVTGHTASKGAAASFALRITVIEAVESVIRGEAPEFLADPGVTSNSGYRIGTAYNRTKGR